MRVDTGDLRARVTLALGEARTLPLPAYAGAKLDWTATPLSTAEVADVRIDIGPLPGTTEEADATAEPPPMVLGPETLVVTRRAAGSQPVWRLRLAQSFDPDHPAAEHDLIVEVTG